jgi:hypothetical protein
MLGILLYIIASLLFPIVAMANLLVVLYKTIRVRGLWKSVNSNFLMLAQQIDIFANVSFPILWNTLLKNKHGYSFGVKKETLSSALGKNQINNTLSIGGKILVGFIRC